MRILFLQDRGVNESLAICALSAVLKKAGHETSLVLDHNQRDLAGHLARLRPGLIIIPANILNSVWAVDACARVKAARPGIRVLHGGTLATFHPENLAGRTLADAIVVGEAEGPTLAYLEALEAGRSAAGLANLHIRADGAWSAGPNSAALTEVWDAPIPDRALYYHYPFMRRMPFKRFCSGRGCPYSCSYCFNERMREIYQTSSGDFVRKRRPALVVEEILHVKKISPLKSLHFSDDIFPADKEWVRRFTELYRSAVGMPYSLNATAEALTETLIADLSTSGCRAVCVGVEVGNEERRLGSLNKAATNDELIAVSARLHAAKIKLITFNMMALKDERAEDVRETIALNHKLRAHHALVGFAFPIPGTRMYEDAVKDHKGLKTVLDQELERQFHERRRPMFGGEDDQRLERLYPFFTVAVRWPRLLPWAWRRSRRPLSPVLKGFLALLSWYAMKRAFRVPALPGLIFHFKAGEISRRTTIYSPLL